MARQKGLDGANNKHSHHLLVCAASEKGWQGQQKNTTCVLNWAGIGGSGCALMLSWLWWARLHSYLSIQVLQVWQQLQHLLPVVRQRCQGVALKAGDLGDRHNHTQQR